MNRPASPILPRAPRPSTLLHWYVLGLRTALFHRPRWQALHAGPLTVAVLLLVAIALAAALGRLDAGDGAQFNWRALGTGWLPTVLFAWACYLARPDLAYDPHPAAAPGPAHLFCAMLAQSQLIMLAVAGLYLVLRSAGLHTEDALGRTGAWALWLSPLIWSTLAHVVLLLRGGIRRLVPRLAGAGAVVFAMLAYFWFPPAQFWRAQGNDYASRPDLVLTQEMMEAQPQLLAMKLDEIAPQRPGIVDLYALSFAPYADEDVFRNESAMVSEVMAQRFDAQGRTLQLVNHVDTTEDWPWATPLNLRRAIRHVATLMDPEEDILFLHLTSHGARNGELAAEFWPMTVGSVTPEDLKAWLDEAGIRYRVLSISACYSGSWIPLLTDEHTLVMTAADADHTSYGCGRGSELTFFGRALYHEQLREHTLSFEQAHATARELIKQREEEAGKDDGYSNPQIAMGAAIRPRLEQLQQRLAR